MSLSKLIGRLNQKMRDFQPVLLLDEASRSALISRYANSRHIPSSLNCATVQDFCDSADHLPQICYQNGDLKNVQRAWIVKSILGQVPIGSKLLEIGGGVPLAAGALEELGYRVTLVDPYEGAGNGPTEYQTYTRKFPNIKFIKDYFNSDLSRYLNNDFDCIYSISVLEHISADGIKEIYKGIDRFLKPRGFSIHCMDVVVDGNGAQSHIDLLKLVFCLQQQLMDSKTYREDSDQRCEQFLSAMSKDLETFYLSAEGHNLWRGGLPYEKFPFRKVISAQSVVTKSP